MLTRTCPSCKQKEMVMVTGGYQCRSCRAFDADNCPSCPPYTGVFGKDPLCDKHYKEYLGQHVGARGEDDT